LKSLSFGLLAIIASAFGEPSAAAGPDVTWYSIVTQNGAAIGHASQEIVQGQDGREIDESQEIDVVEQSDPPQFATRFDLPKSVDMSWRTVRREDKSGRTISISATSQIGPDWRNDWSRNDARIADGKAEITRTTPAEARTLSIALPPGVRFDSGDGLLEKWNPATQPRLEFDNLNVDAMAVEHVTIETAPNAAADPQGGVAVLRKVYDGGQLVAVARLLLDRDGRIVEATQPMFGVTITIKAADRETALRSHSPFRIFPNVMTKSPYRISTSAMTGHIRYRFTFLDGIEFALPQTGEQRVTAGPGFATVDICEDCGPGLPHDAAALTDAMKPTVWMQSDSPLLKAIADPVAKLAISDSRKMEMLAKITRSYLVRIDFTGHYSALETLSRRSGDCTEAAVLLAALGRAAGIPTRVANGLVYSRPSYHGISNVFLPHSWTLAWADGKWRSFDSALENFDSTHIALTVGDGDSTSVSAATQLAGLLRWESMAEVRSRAGN
jgi:hypothetical protein